MVIRAAQVAISWVSRTQAAAAGVALLLMLILIVGNMAARAVGSAFFGTIELVGLIAVLVHGLALADAQQRQAHVAIDIVMSRRPIRVQLIAGAGVAIVAAALFALAARQLVHYSWNLREQGATTESLRLAYWPFSLTLALGFAGLALAMLGDLMAITRNLRSDRPQGIW